jgi:hypothetical protein
MAEESDAPPAAASNAPIIDTGEVAAAAGPRSGAAADFAVGSAQRMAELEAAILTDRRILMGGGLQCPCPGCGPDDEEFDPWAPAAPSRSMVGAFGVQQAQEEKSGAGHAEALNAEVTERLELNQLELAELRQKLGARTANLQGAAAGVEGTDVTGA